MTEKIRVKNSSDSVQSINGYPCFQPWEERDMTPVWASFMLRNSNFTEVLDKKKEEKTFVESSKSFKAKK